MSGVPGRGRRVRACASVRTSEASAEVRAPIDVAFAFLADLRNHWRLASRWIEVASLTPEDGPATAATVQLSGPLGLRRSVETVVDEVTAPRTIRGHGVGGRTRAEVTWRLERAGDRTRVRVTVDLTEATLADRVIWQAGGRAWLARRLRGTLSRLEAVLVASSDR